MASKQVEQWRPPKRSHTFLTADGWVTETYVAESEPNVLSTEEARLLIALLTESLDSVGEDCHRASENQGRCVCRAERSLRNRLTAYAEQDSSDA